jgi:hypothetical protein
VKKGKKMGMKISLRTGDITSESRYIKRIEGVFEDLMKYAKVSVDMIQDKDSLQAFLESAKAKGVSTGGLNLYIQKTDRYKNIVQDNLEENERQERQKKQEFTSRSELSAVSKNKKNARSQGIVYLHSKGRRYAYDYGLKKRVSYRTYSQKYSEERKQNGRKSK